MRLQIVVVLSAFICAAVVKAQTTGVSENPPQSPTQSNVQTNSSSVDEALQLERGSVKRELTDTVQRSVSAAAQTKRALPADRLDLETTVVSGNRALPKVLYIVPWKKAELGELPAQPFNTLLDEVLAPVDRDVFRREVKYFHAVDGAGKALPAPPASGAAPSGTGSGQGLKN